MQSFLRSFSKGFGLTFTFLVLATSQRAAAAAGGSAGSRGARQLLPLEYAVRNGAFFGLLVAVYNTALFMTSDSS